jgi:hypothetical protein
MGRMVIGLLAATSILALAGCNSGHHKASGSQRASKSSQEPAVYATDAISPDGKRMAVVRHTSKGEYLEIGRAGGHGPWQRIYRSSYYLTTDRAPDPDDADSIEAAAQAVDVVLAVLRGYGLESDDAIHATRIIRASLHGFVSLEASKGFGLPLDIDETFARLTQLLDRGLTARAPVE